MLTNRPYRPTLSMDAALAVLEKVRGVKLNPDAVDIGIKFIKGDFSSQGVSD